LLLRLLLLLFLFCSFLVILLLAYDPTPPRWPPAELPLYMIYDEERKERALNKEATHAKQDYRRFEIMPIHSSALLRIL